MRKSMKVTAALAAGMILLSACGGSETAAPASPAAPAAPEAPAGPSPDDCEAGISYRIANHLGPSVVGNLAFEEMILEIAEKSDGRLSGQNFPGGQLGGIAEYPALLTDGTLEFAWLDASTLGAKIESLGWPNLPFLFETDDDFHRIMDGPVGADMNAQILDELGIEVLGWSSVGAVYPFFAGKTVRTPADLAGTKMRVAQAPVSLETWRLLGTQTFAMGLGDTYTGLQTGSIEAYPLPYWATVATKLYEVSDTMSELPVAFANLNISASSVWLNSLCEYDQAVIREAVANAITFNRTGWPAADLADRQYLIEAGLEMVAIPDVEPFRALVLPQWEEFERNSAEDYFTRALAELGF